ncbi:MAG: chemotaxis protein CheW [Yoonia sp.]|uniref:chemotaxis protein CheW n=1 Tax=Yoonia sp. TaxID=2212373 RepID=UPI003EF9E81E
MSNSPETRSSRKLEFVNLIAGGQGFCIEITQIREIRRWSPVTILPHAPSHVLGVINLRGAVIAIIDLAAKLGFTEIIGVDESEIKETPRSPDDQTTRAVEGIIPGEADMTKIINLHAVLASDRAVEAA